MQINRTDVLAKRFTKLFLIALVLTTITALALHPSRSAQADSTLCSGSQLSVCINAGYTAHGYESNYTKSYWKAYSGHNCTNYVGYMLSKNGASEPSFAMGNASEWANSAKRLGAAINNIPTVGSIAHWNYGHVAYVERVSSDSVTISEDNYPSGPFRWRVISRGSSQWPNNFLHIKDAKRKDIAWMQGNTIFTFQSPGLPTIGSVGGIGKGDQMIVLDYNNDGRDDIVQYYADRGIFYVLLNDGKTFYSMGNTPIRGPGVGNSSWAAAADVDGDGRKDLVWMQGNTIFTFKTPGFPTIGSVNGIGKGEQMLVLDYNGDGKDDIIQYYANPGIFYVLLSDGKTFYSGGAIRGPGVGNSSWAGVGDFDGDGRKDIAWMQGNTIFTFKTPGLATIGSVNGIVKGDQMLVMDYNMDGRDDIIQYYTDAGIFYVLLSDGKTFYSGGAVRGPGVGNAAWAGVGDFDGI